MDLNLMLTALGGIVIGGFGYLLVLFKNGKKKEIYSVIKSLVDDAEIKFGSGTGELKYEYVVGKIYMFLPGYIKLFVSEKLLDVWIENAVDELQRHLAVQVGEDEVEDNSEIYEEAADEYLDSFYGDGAYEGDSSEDYYG